MISKLITTVYTGMPSYYDGHRFYPTDEMFTLHNRKHFIQYGVHGGEWTVVLHNYMHISARLLIGIRNADKSNPDTFRFTDGAIVEVALPSTLEKLCVKISYSNDTKEMTGYINEEYFQVAVAGEIGVELVNMLHISDTSKDGELYISEWSYRRT